MQGACSARVRSEFVSTGVKAMSSCCMFRRRPRSCLNGSERLCDFANGVGEYASQYVPPLVRALVVHFMMGYDHYFVDGNGRTARVIAQWVMLREGFFLMDFVPVSRLLRRAPAQYARSFLEVEQDEGDLTYFLIWHARDHAVVAIRELHEYLAEKVQGDGTGEASPEAHRAQ